MHVTCLSANLYLTNLSYSECAHKQEAFHKKKNRITMLISYRTNIYLASRILIDLLKWAVHVIRMEEQSPTRRVLVAVVVGRRQRGRPKRTWEDGVMEDARKLGERNWRNVARNRDSWQKLLKKALAQKWLLCQ